MKLRMKFGVLLFMDHPNAFENAEPVIFASEL